MNKPFKVIIENFGSYSFSYDEEYLVDAESEEEAEELATELSDAEFKSKVFDESGNLCLEDHERTIKAIEM